MATSKKIDKICLVILAITLAVLILFMNGERLGIQAVADEDAENYTGTEYFTRNDMNGTWDTSDATVITLNGDSATVKGSGAYAYDGDVVIVQSGFYVVSGELTDGSIIVDAEDFSKVWIQLAGASITCSDDAALRINEADKTFLTLAEGTENLLASGATYSEEALEDGTGGTIYAHDDLTINGSGSLTVTAEYKHGIEANDELRITGGTITITAPQDGINVNDEFSFTAANLTIAAGDDGIHSDTAVYILDGTITITESYEGIEGIIVEIYGGDLEIHSSDDGINANGGSNSFGGGMMGGFGDMGGFGGQMGFSAQAGSTDTTEDTEAQRGTVDSVNMQIETNATDAETYILIAGGNITIINENGRDADGLDSNGDLIITGGTTRIFLSGSGGNCAIDYGSENGGIATISGGILIACGGSSLIEEIDDSSEQVSIMINGTNVDAGATIELMDADGTVLLSDVLPYDASSITFSCPELQLNGTYTAVLGETTQEITAEEMATVVGSSGMGGFGGMGGQDGFGGHGGMGNFGGQDGQESADGEMPEMPQMGENGEMPTPPEMSEDGEMPAFGNFDGEMPQMSEDGERPERPDMGSFDGERPERPDGGFGGGPGGRTDDTQSGTESDATDNAVQTDATQAASGAVAADGTVSPSAWILVGICAAALLAGILIAAFFRSKNGL